jgi:hypothetical protein
MQRETAVLEFPMFVQCALTSTRDKWFNFCDQKNASMSINTPHISTVQNTTDSHGT